MTSNGDHSTLTSTPPSSVLTNARDDHSNHRPSRPASTAASPKLNKITQNDKITNGENHVDDEANLSEAETVVLEKHDPSDTKVIKTERSEDDLRSIKEEPHPRSPVKNGSKSSRDEHTSLNGAKHGAEPDAKSPVSTSPSSRTTSRHTKDTSPTGSTRSPVYSATSPPQPTGRGRSSSTLDSRKRKIRDDSHPKGLEPPRQKVKTEGLKESRYPASPATPGFGLSHKRSQSTQSIATGTTGRRRRELAVSTERKQWSDESSDDESSPRPTQTPFLAPHTRVKRSDHRALTSPARTMPPARKLDKYGATQLSRESERGNLSAVKEAYEAAPEELNHADFAGFTPLQKASLHGWADVVKFLIAKGCRTDCESLNRDTPLIDAVENGHLGVVRLLLNEGRVNPHHQNKKGQRAIDVLDHEEEDAEEIEKELTAAMRRHVDTSTNDEYAQSGLSQTKSASRLLYNEYNTETLVEKAGDGDILAVGELINSNIKPNIACGVAASRGGHYDILSILLASGLKADPDPSKHSETPMLVAIGRGHLKIVNLLLEQDNFDPTRRNREGKTYFEISEDRRGPKWQEEKDILKNAFDNYKHKSPKRNRKDPSIASAARFKRKSSPARRERSSSPRTDSKRGQSAKASAPPQKARRLMSGKAMAANREVKRRRRVVDEETSEDDDSEDEVRAPTKKTAKPRAMSEGEEHKPVKKIKVRSEEQDVTKRAARAASHDSDHERRRKPGPKIKTRVERVSSGSKHTPDPDSLDEKKPVKTKIRSKPLEDVKAKKRRASDVSVDDGKVKKTPTVSAKSTPAPSEKASTPDVVARERERERKQEERKQEERKQEEQKHAEQQAEKQAIEAKRKAAEEAARRREEEEKEAARKAAEEEIRKKAEAEAEARRIAEEEAEKARQREAEEAKRRAEEEEARRKEALEAQRQKEFDERLHRVASLPRALRRACELGNNRPLHFSGEELGISAVFLPLFCTTSEDLQLGSSTAGKIYIPSFQIVGILGLRELNLAHLDAPYSSWDRIPFTHKHRDLLLRQYDVALLAQDFRFPMEGTPDFDYAKIQESIKQARQQFMTMEGLYWVEDSVLCSEVEKVESLQPLLEEIKDVSKRRRIHLVETEAQLPEKKHKPRKSFMDTVLANNGTNGITAKISDGS
ncbi:hypothetical protein DM02DRAFT_612553 [Periconia macrospinosa]|uniref:Uncharacterized protein n=1 Tax=Periconia macrospinosa TaxID=97972 RepID=A0A2V1DZU7_9PLEO|nr:hypothetical protein DM02DRAFT_612553 [Periconia macrospinosa]